MTRTHPNPIPDINTLLDIRAKGLPSTNWLIGSSKVFADVPGINPKKVGNLSDGKARFPEPLNFLYSSLFLFISPMGFALGSGAMAFLIVHVFLRGSPAEISQIGIGRNAVQVPTQHSFRARTNKCLKNKLVDVEGFSGLVSVKDYDLVSTDRVSAGSEFLPTRLEFGSTVEVSTPNTPIVPDPIFRITHEGEGLVTSGNFNRIARHGPTPNRIVFAGGMHHTSLRPILLNPMVLVKGGTG